MLEGRSQTVWCVCWASFSHLCASVTKQYNLVPVKGRLPCDWGAQTLWSVCGWQVKLCDPLVTHGPCLTSRCCPAWQLRLITAVLRDSLLCSMWLSVMTWLILNVLVCAGGQAQWGIWIKPARQHAKKASAYCTLPLPAQCPPTVALMYPRDRLCKNWGPDSYSGCAMLLSREKLSKICSAWSGKMWHTMGHRSLKTSGPFWQIIVATQDLLDESKHFRLTHFLFKETCVHFWT